MKTQRSHKQTNEQTQGLGHCCFGCCEQGIQYLGAFCSYLCTSQVLRWSRWRWGWGLTSSRALEEGQWVLNISNRLEIRFFPTGRLAPTAGVHKGSGFTPSSLHTLPRLSSLIHPTLCESPQLLSSPGLTEKDLPAKLEVFTISVTLTFRHVWSVSGAAVGVQWVGPETGKGEMRGCEWASREGGQLGMLYPKKDTNPL